jgi:hypothetical protein
MEKAKRKQTIFSSKPLGVTASIFLANNALKLLKTVSMYWRVGLLKATPPTKALWPLRSLLALGL